MFKIYHDVIKPESKFNLFFQRQRTFSGLLILDFY